MFGDMMGKLQEMQQKSQEVKKRLDSISVEGLAEGGKVRVSCNGNRKIKSIQLDESLFAAEKKEEVEDLILIASNRALEKAEKLAETEMAGVAKGIIPGMP